MSAAMLKDRFLYELGLLVQLKEKHNCILDLKPTKDMPLTVYIKLHIKDFDYEFNIVYPEYYPFQPMIINAITDFNTSHIYNSGDMCLKWGIDNWHEDITSVEMVENLIELITIENPLGQEHGIATSGHQFSVQQEMLRASLGTLLIHDDIDKLFKRNKGKGILIYRTMKTNKRKDIFFFKKIGSEAYFKIIKDANPFLEAEFIYHKLNMTEKQYETSPNELKVPPTEGFQLIVFTDQITLRHHSIPTDDDVNMMFGDVEQMAMPDGKSYTKEAFKKTFFRTSKIDVKQIQEEKKSRINIEEQVLNKKIMIFGLGSVGSRVLMDLARAGFQNFILVDDDIFLPNNILRHELGMFDIGDFKIIALAEKVINQINRKANIETLGYSFNGQNSSNHVDDILLHMSKSDIIIDCTADSNLIFSIDEAIMKYDIPYVSGTVISGGIGNILIKRDKGSLLSVVDILETQKKFMRYNNIDLNFVGDYQGRIGSREYVATMSDVSIIAGLVGKTAINMLSNEPNQKLKNDIYIMSTNNDFLGEFYNTQPINANKRIHKPKLLDPIIIKLGEAFYEDNHT